MEHIGCRIIPDLPLNARQIQNNFADSCHFEIGRVCKCADSLAHILVVPSVFRSIYPLIGRRINCSNTHADK